MKDFLNTCSQSPGNIVSQPQRRIIFPLLQKDYGLPADTHNLGEFFLRQAMFGSIFLNSGSHHNFFNQSVQYIVSNKLPAIKCKTLLQIGLSDHSRGLTCQSHDKYHQTADQSYRQRQGSYEDRYKEKHGLLNPQQAAQGIVKEDADDKSRQR